MGRLKGDRKPGKAQGTERRHMCLEFGEGFAERLDMSVRRWIGTWSWKTSQSLINILNVILVESH